MAALGTRRLTLEIDGDDVTAQVSTVTISGGDADSQFLSFADAAANGSREYTLNFTATQDMAADSVWDKIWTASGTEVPIEIWPNGGTTPSATTPKFTATAVISEPADGVILGGDANASPSARFTIDGSWTLTAKPTKVTA